MEIGLLSISLIFLGFYVFMEFIVPLNIKIVLGPSNNKLSTVNKTENLLEHESNIRMAIEEKNLVSCNTGVVLNHSTSLILNPIDWSCYNKQDYIVLHKDLIRNMPLEWQGNLAYLLQDVPKVLWQFKYQVNLRDEEGRYLPKNIVDYSIMVNNTLSIRNNL